MYAFLIAVIEFFRRPSRTYEEAFLAQATDGRDLKAREMELARRRSQGLMWDGMR